MLSYILLQLNSFSVLEMMDTIDEFLIKYILDLFSFLKIFKSYIGLLQFLRIHAYESWVIEKLSFFFKKTWIKLCRMSIYIYSSWTPVGEYKFEGEPSMDIFKSYWEISDLCHWLETDLYDLLKSYWALIMNHY